MASEDQSARNLVKQMKGLDTSGVEVDEEQEALPRWEFLPVPWLKPAYQPFACGNSIC